MLGGGGLQVITFVAGCEGVGRSSAIANLGVALARLGREVLIIDEHGPGDDVASALGVQASYDLLHVMQRELPLARVLLKPMQGLSILPAARAVHKLGRLSLKQQQILLDAMSDQARPVDVILVDARSKPVPVFPLPDLGERGSVQASQAPIAACPGYPQAD